MPVKPARGIGFRDDGTHLSVVGDDGSITWRVTDSAKADDAPFNATQAEEMTVWKSGAGDVVTAPKPKTPAKPTAPRVALTPDGRLRFSLHTDGTATLEEVP